MDEVEDEGGKACQQEVKKANSSDRTKGQKTCFILRNVQIIFQNALKLIN
jgi:hypothetical protein